MVDQDVLSARLNALETYSSELRAFRELPATIQNDLDDLDRFAAAMAGLLD